MGITRWILAQCSVSPRRDSAQALETLREARDEALGLWRMLTGEDAQFVEMVEMVLEVPSFLG